MALKVIDAHMPAQFKEFYPSTRTIIDCTEIFTEVPSSMSVQSLTYSSYKHHSTFEGLTGICPTGAITFISQLYAGSIYDQALTHDCGLLELIEPGGSIMADKGFDIAYDELLRGENLNTLLKDRQQLLKNNVILTCQIASLRYDCWT